jgi:hypothetical protein
MVTIGNVPTFTVEKPDQQDDPHDPSLKVSPGEVHDRAIQETEMGDCPLHATIQSHWIR